MPLDPIERQRLRLVQEHLTNQAVQAGALLHPINTVLVVHHPQLTDAAFNFITPNKGVAWTQQADIQDSFEYLSKHHRTPHFQFLDMLFPDAYQKYLQTQHYKLQDAVQLWLYAPFVGPALPDEMMYGRLQTPSLLKGMRVELVASENHLQQWRDFHTTPDIITPIEQYRWLGMYHHKPIGTIQLIIQDGVGGIMPPAIIKQWRDFGLEIALRAQAIDYALSRACQIVYTIDNKTDVDYMNRLGFVKFTRLLSYGNEAETDDPSLAEILPSNNHA